MHYASFKVARKFSAHPHRRSVHTIWWRPYGLITGDSASSIDGTWISQRISWCRCPVSRLTRNFEFNRYSAQILDNLIIYLKNL